MKKYALKIIIIVLGILTVTTGVILYKVFSDKVTYKDIEVRNNEGYIQYKYDDEESWRNLLLLETLNGKDGKEIEVTRDKKFIKWRYKGEEDWNNLINISDLIGQDGKNGKSGKDGREIEISVDDEYIKYRYKGDKNWINLIKISTLKGKDGLDGTNGNDGASGSNGKEIELKNDGTYIKWRYKGTTEWNNLAKISSLKGKDGANGTNGTDGKNGLDGTNGADGREIELENDGTNIKWRYKGDTTWNTLTSLADLKGDKGDNGSEIELENDGTYIKWKYKDTEDWITLIDTNTLKGQDGLAWIDLGVVDVDNFCDPDNEDDCSALWYIKRHLPYAEMGNYVFTDNQDSFKWYVKLEKTDDDANQKVLIQYWSTEEVFPYYIQGWYDDNTAEWEMYDINFVTWDELQYYVNGLKDMIKAIDYQDLGTVDVLDGCDVDNESCPEHYMKTKLVEQKNKNGKYIFIDNDDNFTWYVKVEIAKVDSGYNRAMVTYWSTEECYLYTLVGEYDVDDKEWYWSNSYSYATFTDVNNVRNSLNTINSNLLTKINANTSELKRLSYYTILPSKSYQKGENIEDLIKKNYYLWFTGPDYSSDKPLPICLSLIPKTDNNFTDISDDFINSYFVCYTYLGTNIATDENGNYIKRHVSYVEYFDINNPDVVRYAVATKEIKTYNYYYTLGEWKTKTNINDLVKDIESLQTETNSLKQKNEELETKISELEAEVGKLTVVRFDRSTMLSQLESYFKNVSDMPVGKIKYYIFIDLSPDEPLYYITKVIGSDNMFKGTNYIEFYSTIDHSDGWVGYGTVDSNTKDITWTWKKKQDVN